MHDAAFHLGLHCLPKNQFMGFQYTKDLQMSFEVTIYKDHKNLPVVVKKLASGD